MFALGLLGLLLGVFVGGVIPATVALLLARQTARQAYAAGGYLTGSRLIRRGRALAWAGIVVAVAVLVVAAILGLLQLADAPTGTHFAPGTS